MQFTSMYSVLHVGMHRFPCMVASVNVRTPFIPFTVTIRLWEIAFLKTSSFQAPPNNS